MKKAVGTLEVSTSIDCPHCEENVNLFDIESLTDEGYIYTKLLRNDGFGNDKLSIEVKCPECSKEFIVTEVTW